MQFIPLPPVPLPQAGEGSLLPAFPRIPDSLTAWAQERGKEKTKVTPTGISNLESRRSELDDVRLMY